MRSSTRRRARPPGADADGRTAPAYDWAIEFDGRIGEQIAPGRLDELADFQQLGELARLAHPTHEHLLPLLYAVRSAHAGEPVQFFNTGVELASVSMRSVLWA